MDDTKILDSNTEEKKEFWVKTVLRDFPSNLLFSIAIQYFNEGLLLMRILALKDLMLNKKYYATQPSTAQAITVLSHFPQTCKVLFGLIVDARLVNKRKLYLIFFGFTGTITQFLIGLGGPEALPLYLLAILVFIYNIGAVFLDATIDSISIQQARRNPG